MLPKKEYKCDLCNVKFVSPAQEKIHFKTEKHINNNKLNNIDKNKTEIENDNLKLEVLHLNEKIKDLENKNQLIINKLQHLETENQNLKNNQKLHINHETIYIIHCAQHINTNVYKVGRTNNILRRYKEYPKGSDLLYTFRCRNSKIIESKILNYLNNNNIFKKMECYGNEYFQCDLNYLKDAVMQFIN